MPCYCGLDLEGRGRFSGATGVFWPIPQHALLHWHSANLYTCANEREVRRGSCVLSILLRVVWLSEALHSQTLQCTHLHSVHRQRGRHNRSHGYNIFHAPITEPSVTENPMRAPRIKIICTTESRAQNFTPLYTIALPNGRTCNVS